jgi:LmbE family N-acetylglucosaminyl deacetylase
VSTHLCVVPHMDDETLAMGGHIASWRRAGEQVVLLLVTDSVPSTRLRRIFRGAIPCPVHGGFHPLEVDLAAARVAECQAAVRALGVEHVIGLHLSEDLVQTHPAAFVAAVQDAMRRYGAAMPEVVYHVVSGNMDVALPLPGTHPTHQLCWEAAHGLGVSVFGHRVYSYRLPITERMAPRILSLDPQLMAVKRAALAAYTRWDPPQHIAFGFHSIPDLLAGAASDPREFVDVPE